MLLVKATAPRLRRNGSLSATTPSVYWLGVEDPFGIGLLTPSFCFHGVLGKALDPLRAAPAAYKDPQILLQSDLISKTSLSRMNFVRLCLVN
jgi:hypothetical protein